MLSVRLPDERNDLNTHYFVYASSAGHVLKFSFHDFSICCNTVAILINTVAILFSNSFLNPIVACMHV